jgi:NADP-dependent 3-hydroxy acid dehydrogenase YdfG
MQETLKRWQGRTALVTGGSSGIGRAAAMALADIEMRIAISGRRSERLGEVKEVIEERGSEALVLQGDQTVAAANYAFFEKIRDTWGGVDLLVNNAGTSGGRPFVDVEFSVIQDCFDLNIRAAAICMREAVKDMKARDGGTIINLSSMNAHRYVAGRGSPAYAASKHALRLLTEGLRSELAAEKSPIKIAMISPGLVDTDFHRDRGIASFGFPPLQPEDIVQAMLYILSTPPRVQVCDIQIRPIHQSF